MQSQNLKTQTGWENLKEDRIPCGLTSSWFHPMRWRKSHCRPPPGRQRRVAGGCRGRAQNQKCKTLPREPGTMTQEDVELGILGSSVEGKQRESMEEEVTLRVSKLEAVTTTCRKAWGKRDMSSGVVGRLPGASLEGKSKLHQTFEIFVVALYNAKKRLKTPQHTTQQFF
ncbi:hypothetical protein C8R44DRAFT_742442 [Mycena epipterygia]|nr:hypothetical protein C8R44DRAFT_742442 [Mycena epipterygia]